MNNWVYMKNSDRQSAMVSCVESLRPALYQMLLHTEDDVRDFDYYVDACVDHNIILLLDGCEFAVADTDIFKGPGDFIAWVIDALNTYYKEEEDE